MRCRASLWCLLVLMCGHFMVGDPVFEGLSVKDWHGWCVRAGRLVEGASAGVFRLKGAWGEIRGRAFPVSSKGRYRLSGEFRTPVGASAATEFYFGFVPLTPSGQQITSSAVGFVSGTETVLFDCVELGDREVEIVPPPSVWESSGTVVFGARKDLSDVPNLSGMSYSGITRLADRWVLRLDRPARHDYKSGVWVRRHVPAAAAMYTAACLSPASSAWTGFSGEVSGEVSCGVSSGRWWRGTAQASVMIMKYKGELEFRNIRVERIEEE